MGIQTIDFRYMKNYQEYLDEKLSINSEELERKNIMIKDITKIKENVNNLNSLINELKIMIVNQDSIQFLDFEKDNNKLYTELEFKGKSDELISAIRKYLTTDIPIDLRNKYFEIIYPDGERKPFNIDIEIETNHFNRIHIPVGLPQILKNIGLGKQIYRKLIFEIDYISTLKLDQSLDAIFVWDSLRKDKDIYSYLKENQMLCINPALPFEEIKKILLEFFKIEIENEKNKIKKDNYILDSDFRDKYPSEIYSSELRFLM
jgi:hypothetical protein